MPSTILLVDDHPVFRQGLRRILEKEKDLKVVGEAGDGLKAIDRFRDLSPDIVVMDINMPNLDGIGATRQILSESPDTKVVALSVHSGKQFVRDMIQAGASGYILKESIPEEMIEGIRTVLSGDVYLSKSISNVLVSDYKTLISESEPAPDGRSASILYTKLHHPPIASHIVPRTRLVQLLENSVQNPVTLIAAPAGYGKSILAGQWLDVSEFPGAWVSLDENDNDVRVFLSYILEAIQNLFPQQELKSKTILGSAELPAIPVISRYLLNDLEPLSERFILILDDFHLINNAAIHELMGELLLHPSQSLHLALLTRRDPPLPLTALRGRGMLTEITTSHLRFTVSETKLFLERFLHIAIADKTAQILEDKMEGWVTGLHLAALSIKDEADQERLTAGLLETSQYVQDYLFHEVISHVPPQVQRFLMQTAILDRFCASLCDSLSAVDSIRNQTEADVNGQNFIDWLIKTKLFVIALDRKNRWFRYHHLFQEILQSQLKQKCSPEEIAALHSRASEWHSENGLIDEAIQHALAADDVSGAARLVEQNRQRMLNLDRWFVVEKWLSMFPETVVQQQPGLLMTKAWILYHHFDIANIPSVIDAVEAILSNATDDRSLRGETDFFRGYLCYFQNDGERSLKHLDNAIKNIPESADEIRGQSEILHGLASQMQGEKERAVKSLNDLLYRHRSSKSIRITRLQVALVYIHIISGDLFEALLANRQLHDFAAKNTYTYARIWSVYLRGLIHFYRNDLEEAIGHFQQAVEQKYLLHTRAVVDSMAGLAFAHQAMGQPDQAGNTMQLLYAYVDSLKDPTYSTVARSCHARLSIMQGELESGLRRLQESPPIENMVWWLEIPAVTHCRALLAEGSNRSMEKSEVKLRELLQLNQDNHNTCHMIQILPLLALTCKKQDRVDEALIILQRAVNLAEPGEWMRPFVELGPPMADLLRRLHGQKVAVDYIIRILDAFPDAASTPPVPDLRSTTGDLQVESEPIAQIENRIRQTNGGQESKIENLLVEPLTNRELDVLELLAQRLQSKEIADKLSISTVTVKSHLKNIYQKLGVTGRRQAVKKAKNLRIL